MPILEVIKEVREKIRISQSPLVHADLMTNPDHRNELDLEKEQKDIAYEMKQKK